MRVITEVAGGWCGELRGAVPSIGRLAALVVLAALSAPAALAQQPPVLRAPIDCTPGADCWISTFFDHEPGPGYTDHACGPLSNDGHPGISYAISNLAAMERGVTVVAAAGGVVVGIRDDMPDVDVRDIGPAAVAGRECGNGVRIDHGGGWATQYCHLKLGSIVVQPGEDVAAGTPLGQVGLSGFTGHPHLYLNLSHDGTDIDPFTGTAAGEAGACGNVSGTLWHPDTLRDFRYETGLIRDLILAPRLPEQREVFAGTAGRDHAGRDAEALVLWVVTIGTLRDHSIAMKITGPDGKPLSEHVYAEPKVYASVYIGSAHPEGGWPPGLYRGEAVVTDGQGRVTDRREIAIEIR